METDTIRETEASVIWRELDKEINMLRTLLEDLERRVGGRHTPSLVQVAARSHILCGLRVTELSAELVGVTHGE